LWLVLPSWRAPSARRVSAAGAGRAASADFAFTGDREEALGRLDRGTGIRHRPATALSDTLANQDPVAQVLWQAQRERTLASTGGFARPAVAAACDPRSLGACARWSGMLVASYVAAGDERTMRVASAFDWNGVWRGNIRVDAW